MEITGKSFKSETDLASFIREGKPTLFLGSKTSTVLPYDKLERFLPSDSSLVLGDLSQLPKKCHLDKSHNLVIEGPVTWQEAAQFCQSKGRLVMTSPTEELACVLSGLATSCTGERSFGFGTLRDQVVSIEFIDANGEKILLESHKSLCNSSWFEEEELLTSYQKNYAFYQNFKNAPFPRLKHETDLMVGTEGQLGVIVKAVFKTAPLKPLTFLFLSLPKWENDFRPHLEIYERVQSLRDHIISCELIDENSWSLCDSAPVEGRDTIFLEIYEESLDKVYHELLLELSLTGEENIFEMSPGKFNQLRMAIPRQVAEKIAREGVVKKGTDIQIQSEMFSKLLEKYRELAGLGVTYNLFGHFGDAHLHFNFLPKREEEGLCQDSLFSLYNWVKEKKGSPFAEHGVGLIKKEIIKDFYGDEQREVFRYLKNKLDPQRVFFPYGFMGDQW